MAAGFFQSKPFWIAAILGALILAGAGWAFTQSLNPTVEVREAGCARAIGAGAERLTPATDTGARLHATGVERVITYELNASAANRTAEACSAYGDLEVRPSPDGLVRVIFTIYGRVSDAEAVETTGVEAARRSGGASFGLLAWQATRVSTRTLFSENGVGVDIALELPVDAPWGLTADTRYGDVQVIRIPLATSTVDTSYGDVQVADAHLHGDLTLDTRYGDVRLTVLDFSRGAHRVSLESSYGDLLARLPRAAEHGYDVTASTSYGDALVSIGETESYEANKDQDTVRARSKGWDGKAAQTTVTADTSYGDVDVRT